MNRKYSTLRVAVVGAGFAGLTAGRQLSELGFEVQVFDKARGTGGRMSTRRSDGYEFDFGAQYFTVRNDLFRAAVESWLRYQRVDIWQGKLVEVVNGDVRPSDSATERLVAVPRMNSICHELAEPLTVKFSTRISAIRHTNDAWEIFSEDGQALGRFDRVVVATPPAQAVPLLADAPRIAEQVAAVEMLPCWAVNLAFGQSLGVEWAGAFVHESPLSWVARNSSKPGRRGGEAWVLHASAEWSANHLNTAPGNVGDELIAAFWEASCIPKCEQRSRSVHLWRYAKAKSPLAVECLNDPELGIGVCGDWCRGDRVEDAFLSGFALAQRISDL
jgi:renalase